MFFSVFQDREGSFSSAGRRRLICLGLALAVLVVFGRLAWFDFVFFDDHVYVMEKAEVLAGLTADSVRWAATATDAGFWHPLTWISLMIDHELWGLNPGGYHLTNILLHLGATLLLFAALQRLTGEVGKSGFVAALFAMHPLHVESVAWIAERKDVLSGMFWMLSLLFYARYAEKPGWGRYGLVLASFFMGLAAKAMVVTLPLMLLLLDFWPLGRLGGDNWQRNWRLALGEKLPFLLLAAAVGMATIMAEQQVGALKTLGEFPAAARLANAIVAYGFYLYKVVWPFGLAVHYPHPGAWPPATVGLALAALVVISFIVVRRRKSAPYLLVGWLWYLVSLLPVIGLIQIGRHAFADRYTYIPLIGVFIALVWGVGEWAAGEGVPRGGIDPPSEEERIAAEDAVENMAEARPGYGEDPAATAPPPSLPSWETKGVGSCMAASVKAGDPTVSPVAVAGMGLATVMMLGMISFHQVGYWRDAETLFRRAVAVTDNNWLAANNLGAALSRQGRHTEALPYFAEALRIRPDYVEAVFNKAAALAGQGRYGEALPVYRQVLALQPSLAEAHNNIAIAYARTGDHERALFHFREAIRIRPGYQDAIRNLEKLGGSKA